MNNGKSIFTRYFAICSAVILISFCCLGTVLLLVSSRYFLDEKKSLMLKDARALASYTQEKMLEQPDRWREDVAAEMKTYAIGSNSDYLLCSDDGYVVAATGGEVENIPYFPGVRNGRGSGKGSSGADEDHPPPPSHGH